MSYWTHVNGIMRFDSDVDRDKEMKKMCRTADWDSGRTVKKRCNVPMGSEGSLDVSLVVKKSNIGQSRKYTLSFFGDLRDYPQKKEKGYYEMADQSYQGTRLDCKGCSGDGE